MANQNDKQETVELQEINAELTESLSLCRKLLFDYRSILSANGSPPGPSEAIDADRDENRSQPQETR